MPAKSPDPCDRAAARHLLQRATWGPAPGEIDAVCSVGVDAWLEQQLLAGTRLGQSPPRLPAPIERLLAEHRSHGLEPAQLRTAFPPPNELRRSGVELTQAERRGQSPARLQQELAVRRIVHALHAQDQLRDVLAAFWFDHFNVSIRKGPNRWLVADFEASAIRPHVLGSFEAMLTSVAMHPAMLVFLDNVENVVADSMRIRPGAPAATRDRGGNENFARELLELQTLGIDGGYTEKDVAEVARAFTGWGIAPGGTGGFLFRRPLHDARPKTVLGVDLAPGRGLEDGQEVLSLLAHHPSTAAHLAGRLVRWFVNEEGDPELERAISGVFAETHGDLHAVTLTLFTHPRFSAEENRNAVFRTPFEFAVAALRATGSVLTAPGGVSQPLLAFLRNAGSLPWQEDSPAGIPRGVEVWSGSAHLLERLSFATALAGGRVPGVRTSVARPRGRPDAPLGGRLDPILELLYPGGVPPGVGGPATEASRLLALGLGGPFFQWK